MTPMCELAHLNVTWAGQNGDLPDPVAYDLSDTNVRRVAEEAIRSGTLAGVTLDLSADLSSFMVDRFSATAEIPVPRIFVRPKTPFGCGT